ncbi:MAG TPA: DUF4013 domain-containing protein [Roseiflexaceae bacterium]|nr:DUF4013 domain-containing protein [Roseiflexaceae bacterium]
MNLRTALSNIHRDPQWWRRVLLGGTLALTVLGIPWTSGLVVESLDNGRKGYPTPLPPPGDWATRYLIGFFALIIDMVFFVLPLLLGGLVFGCLLLGSTVFANGAGLGVIGWLATALVGLYLLTMFALGVAPIGRLLYSEEGRPEAAMSADTLRAALHPDTRRLFGQARLLSLPAYLPALALGVALWQALGSNIPGATPLALLLLWLALCALVYAHLVVAQLYAAAARAALER